MKILDSIETGMAGGGPEPDFFVTTVDPVDSRARQRWVEEQRKRSRIAGCTYASAAVTDCRDGSVLCLAAWKQNPMWM